MNAYMMGLGLEFSRVPGRPFPFLRSIPGQSKYERRQLPSSPRYYHVAKEVYLSRTMVSCYAFAKIVGSLPALSDPVWLRANDLCTAVTLSDFKDVDAFFHAVNGHMRGEGFLARLPTELEWEACYYSDVEDDCPYPWAPGGRPEDYAVFNLNQSSLTIPPVMASKKPTGIGAWYDLVGYAVELLLDRPKFKLLAAPDWREYPRRLISDFCASGGNQPVLKGEGCFEWNVMRLVAAHRRHYVVGPVHPTGFRIALERINP